MKKKLLTMIMIVFVLIMSVACSNQKELTAEGNHSQENEAEKIEEGVTENGNESTTPKKEKPQNYQNRIDNLKKINLIGNDSDKVKNQLGEPKVDYQDAVMHAWRFDFTNSNYNYDNELVSVDVVGLTNGQMEAQLFIYFEENVVTTYSIYYLKDKEIMQYMVTKDGAEEFSASGD